MRYLSIFVFLLATNVLSYANVTESVLPYSTVITDTLDKAIPEGFARISGKVMSEGYPLNGVFVANIDQTNSARTDKKRSIFVLN